ncbi:hypothetical protein [Aquihabitans sp. McL0605]|uniref:hypothetical protein n=1 Tax=Aquihabitans sp. McL0605 TaxID=3415671 RepID=UPI003CE80BAA
MSPTSSPAPRSRLTAAVFAAAVAVAVVVLAGCGTPTPKQDDLAQALVDSGVAKPVADCAASALVRSLTPSELQELAERGGGGAPVDDPAKTDDSADKLAKAMTRCKELQLSTAPTTTTTAPGTGAGSGGAAAVTTTTGAPSDGAVINTTTAP